MNRIFSRKIPPALPPIGGGIAALAVIVLGLGAQAVRPANDRETCAVCHEDTVKAFASQPHASLPDRTCTACHGEAKLHLEEPSQGGVFAFAAADPSAEKSRRCLSCHTRETPRYASSAHGRASLDCTACHSVHHDAEDSLRRTDQAKTCVSCHGEIASEFDLNEKHRLKEGIMTCTTCHDPHAPSARTRLGGFKQAECLKCHADKGGPFLYEHQASRVEGCTVCHEVHGSPNRHLLTHQSVADLCFSCHAAAPAWHSRFTSQGSNCVTCHAAIHGSNLSRKFLK